MISFIALQLRHLREHRGRAVLAALGIAAGSALIIAVGVPIYYLWKRLARVY